MKQIKKKYVFFSCLSLFSYTAFHPLQAETIESKAQGQNDANFPRYPNGIPEHQPLNQQYPIQPIIDVTPDPTVRVGPGVVVGPNVYVRGKPLPNPLLKDVIPAQSPVSH